MAGVSYPALYAKFAQMVSARNGVSLGFHFLEIGGRIAVLRKNQVQYLTLGSQLMPNAWDFINEHFVGWIEHPRTKALQFFPVHRKFIEGAFADPFFRKQLTSRKEAYTFPVINKKGKIIHHPFYNYSNEDPVVQGNFAKTPSTRFRPEKDAPLLDRLPPNVRAMIEEFPFYSPGDLLRFVAFLLTIPLSSLLHDKSKPILGIFSNRINAGKTILARVFSLLANDREPGSMDFGSPRLMANQYQQIQRNSNPSTILLDNVRGEMNSPWLEKNALAPTIEIFGGQGASHSVFENQSFWIITSTLAEMTPDLASRMVPVRLHSPGDSLELSFSRDIIDFVRKHREIILLELAQMAQGYKPEMRLQTNPHRCREWGDAVTLILQANHLGPVHLDRKQLKYSGMTEDEFFKRLVLRLSQEVPEIFHEGESKSPTAIGSTEMVSLLSPEDLEYFQHGDRKNQRTLSSEIGKLLNKRKSRPGPLEAGGVVYDRLEVRSVLGRSNKTKYYFIAECLESLRSEFATPFSSPWVNPFNEGIREAVRMVPQGKDNPEASENPDAVHDETPLQEETPPPEVVTELDPRGCSPKANSFEINYWTDKPGSPPKSQAQIAAEKEFRELVIAENKEKARIRRMQKAQEKQEQVNAFLNGLQKNNESTRITSDSTTIPMDGINRTGSVPNNRKGRGSQDATPGFSPSPGTGALFGRDPGTSRDQSTGFTEKPGLIAASLHSSHPGRPFSRGFDFSLIARTELPTFPWQTQGTRDHSQGNNEGRLDDSPAPRESWSILSQFAMKVANHPSPREVPPTQVEGVRDPLVSRMPRMNPYQVPGGTNPGSPGERGLPGTKNPKEEKSSGSTQCGVRFQESSQTNME